MNFVGSICDATLSARSIDDNGYLNVVRSNLAAANVRDYYGSEIQRLIPDTKLDDGKLYKIYTPPEEISLGIDTLKNKPLLLLHTWVLPEEFPADRVVGNVGSTVGVDGIHAYGDLAIWRQDGIDAVENHTHEDISAGYDATLKMIPGTAPSGEQYDGIFRNLRFNHIALVPKGRTGDNVRVADNHPDFNPERDKIVKINRKVLARNLRATTFGICDSAATNFEQIAAAASKDNATAQSLANGIMDALTPQAKPGTAQLLRDGRIIAAIQDADADADNSVIDEGEEEKDKDKDGKEKPKEPTVKDNDTDKDKAGATDAAGKTPEEILSFVKEKMSPRDFDLLKKYCSADGGGATDCSSGNVTDSAPNRGVIDEAALRTFGREVEQRTTQKIQSVFKAREKVLANGHHVGAMDSAAAVFKEALTNMGVDLTGFDEPFMERVYDQEMLLRKKADQIASSPSPSSWGVTDSAGKPTSKADITEAIMAKYIGKK